MKYENGTEHCQGCGALCWSKDLKKGLCYNCFYKKYKDVVSGRAETQNRLPFKTKTKKKGSKK